MKLGVAFTLALVLAAPAQAACVTAHLAVDPAASAGEIAATLKRRLVAAGDANPVVEAEGAGLLARLPDGVSPSVLTRPAKIEFRLVTQADEPGAVSLPRRDGQGREFVEPRIIVKESQLRQFAVRDGASIAFRLDPIAAKNLMTATMEAINHKLAILVDDEIVADPEIRAPVASLLGEVSGGFTPESARELVQLIGTGRLTARVSLLSQEPCKAP